MKTPIPILKVQDEPPAASQEGGDVAAEITDRDVKLAVRSWKENAPERYRGLIDAGQWKGK